MLNDWSIGIELVNFNSNVIDFTEAQYAALAHVVNRLAWHYPALHSDGRAARPRTDRRLSGQRPTGLALPIGRASLPPAIPTSRRLRAQPVCRPVLRDALARFVEDCTGHSTGGQCLLGRVSLLTETAVALAGGDVRMRDDKMSG